MTPTEIRTRPVRAKVSGVCPNGDADQISRSSLGERARGSLLVGSRSWHSTYKIGTLGTKARIEIGSCRGTFTSRQILRSRKATRPCFKFVFMAEVVRESSRRPKFSQSRPLTRGVTLKPSRVSDPSEPEPPWFRFVVSTTAKSELTNQSWNPTPSSSKMSP